MLAITPAETTQSVSSDRFEVHDYIGSVNDDRPGGQVFHVKQFVDVRPHFHEVDEFQVIVGGEGKIGSQKVVAGVLHYASAFSPYGPIVTEPPVGLIYFTLRRQGEGPETNWMPDARAKLQGASAEHFTTRLDDRVTVGGGMVELGASSRGAAAYAERIAPSTPINASSISVTHEGYALVLDGSVDLDGRELPAKSVIDFSSSTELTKLRAGLNGATVMVLLFPNAD